MIFFFICVVLEENIYRKIMQALTGRGLADTANNRKTRFVSSGINNKQKEK